MSLEDAVWQVLSSAALPLKLADIVRQAKPLAGKQASSKGVAAVLDALVGGGRLTCFTAGTVAKPQPWYTTHSLERAAAALLRPHIHNAKKAPDAAKLKAKLPPALLAHFEPALAQLVTLGEAFVVTAGTKRLVHAQAPPPSSLLSAAQRGALQKILAVVNGARSSAISLADFAAWVDGRGADSPATPAPTPALAPPAAPAAEPTEALLREWYEQDHLRSSSVMIPVLQTFNRYAAWAQAHGQSADSQVLRNLMEALYNNGRILLEPCERPQDLPDHERAMLVPMSLGPPGRSWCWSA